MTAMEVSTSTPGHHLLRLPLRRTVGGAAPKLGFRRGNLQHASTSLSSSTAKDAFFPGQRSRPSPPAASAASSHPPGTDDTPTQLALLLEVEGVLVDIYRSGDRHAFNVAFQKLGLDCANWSDPVYLDLARKGGGDEVRMLVIFFNRIGWPTSLPTSEKENFMKSVLREKRKALDEYVITKKLPLRPGVEEFIDSAINKGIPVIMLTAYSKNGEKIARSVTEQLGAERILKIKIIGQKEIGESLYGQLVSSNGISSSLEEQLAKEVNKAASAEKQKIASEVSSLLKLSVDIDTSIGESLEKIVCTLRAGAEFAGVPIQNCVLIAGSKLGVFGAERIGMPCIVVRNSFTSRAEFPSARAIMDGFGGADLSVSKILQKRWS